jgi:hypothetical protein
MVKEYVEELYVEALNKPVISEYLD